MTDLRERAAQAARGTDVQVAENTQPLDTEESFRTFVNRHRAAVDRVLPASLPAERLLQVVLTSCRINPKLAECTPQSLVGALMVTAQVGLEPGPHGHVYLVPFWSKKVRSLECQLIIGYRGYMHLARQSGTFRSIRSYLVTREEVREDAFAVTYGADPTVRHLPRLFDDAGNPLRREQDEIAGAYSIAWYNDSDKYEFWWSSLHDIHEARDLSESYGGRIRQGKDPAGPWINHWEAMYRKTPVRRLASWIDLGVPEIAAAANADERVHNRIDVSALDMPEHPPQESPQEQVGDGDSG